MQTATLPLWLSHDLTGGEVPYLGPGIQDSGTVARVTETADGVSIATLWQEFTDVTRVWNEHRLALSDLTSYRTTVLADAVPQRMTSDEFEIADEYSIPKAMSQDGFLLLGYGYDDHDLRTAFTWKFLRDSTAEQVRQFLNRAFDADASLQARQVFGRMLDPTEGMNSEGHRIYGLFNGTDGVTPPPYFGKSFSANHSHYLVSQADVVDSLDIEEQISMVREHGYGTQPGSQLITFVHPLESEAIQGFRAGVESRPGLAPPKAKYDFLPSASAPPRVQMGTIVGQVAPTNFGGLPIAGSYGPTWICETPYMPAGYVVTLASGGSNSPSNPIALREHPKPDYQGLRLLPGNWVGYPLQDAFFTRGLGSGTRHRGAACVTQIKASGTYDIPSLPR
jgi:hypothetical protein